MIRGTNHPALATPILSLQKGATRAVDYLANQLFK
jgi:hypothetical protein